MASNDDNAPPLFATPEDANPTDTSTVVSCAVLGGQLWVGTFLKLTGSRVVRYISSDNENRCLGNSFIAYEGSLSLPDNKYYKGLVGRELIQTLSSVYFTIDEISDFAFVFSNERVEKEGLLLHGISNAYVCRFCIDNNNIVVPTNLISFPCDFPGYYLWITPFPKRVWGSIKLLQKTFRQILSLKSEKQGFFVPNKKKAIMFPTEVWHYLLMRLSLVDVVVSKTTRSTIGHKVYSGFSRVSVRELQDAQIITVQTQQQLSCLQRILGIYVLFGTRFSRPKLGTIAHLQENSAMNIVSGTPLSIVHENNHPSPTKIQFTFCESDELVVSVSYELYVYRTDNNSTGEPLHCPSRSLRNVILHFSEDSRLHCQQSTTAIENVNCDHLLLIRPGRRFHKDGTTYKVVHFDGGHYVVCRKITAQSAVAINPTQQEPPNVNFAAFEVGPLIFARVRSQVRAMPTL